MLPAALMIVIYSKIVLRRREQAARILPQLSEFRRHSSIKADVIVLSNSLAQNSSQEVSSPGQNSIRQSESNPSIKRLTCLVCTASAIVVVCWLPDQFYYCLFQMGFVDFENEVHDWLIILAFLNTCLNPILYCLSDKQYASEFLTFFCCAYHRGKTKSTANNDSNVSES